MRQASMTRPILSSRKIEQVLDMDDMGTVIGNRVTIVARERRDG